MWSKFGAHGEHEDVFLFVSKESFFLQTLLFTAFLVMVLKF